MDTKTIVGIIAVLVCIWVIRSVFKGFYRDQGNQSSRVKHERDNKFNPKSTKEKFEIIDKRSGSGGTTGGSANG